MSDDGGLAKGGEDVPKSCERLAPSRSHLRSCSPLLESGE